VIIYCLPPIDQWSGWQKPDQVFTGTDKDDGDTHPADEWPELWKEVQRLAKGLGWEGDVREGPFVTVLPREPGDYWPGYVLVAWKQDNNGTTFLASPIHLPWLETDMAEWK
jgi:hypothetical protein